MSRIFKNFVAIFRIYLLGVVCLSLFRLVLLLFNLDQLPTDSVWGLTMHALLVGLQFDTVVSCYIFLLAMPALLIFPFLKRVPKKLLRGVYTYITVCFVVLFALCVMDVSFYDYLHNRLNNVLFLYTDNADFAVGFIFGNIIHYVLFAILVAISVVYIRLMRRIRKLHQLGIEATPPVSGKKHLSAYTGIVLLTLGLVLLGGRGGKITKAPISIGSAFFCHNGFLNQLGLNPAFTLVRSSLYANKSENRRLHWMNDQDARRTAAAFLDADTTLTSSPIARHAIIDSLFAGKNIVVVIMESMASHKMAYFGNTQNLTPFFDSLALQSWFFNRCYSAGIHTFNGVYSTLFSHPALMQRHPMKHAKISLMTGFANTLFEQYHTIFFTTHDEQFDNMSGFLFGNGFQTIVGQKDYPKSEIRSNLGVPDYFMFRHAIPHLRDFHESGKPFFATILTSSDHTPHIIPKDTPFKPRSTAIHQQTTEFADWSLEQFMAMAKAEAWYANTVFVFVADHGSAKGVLRYDIMLSYHHIPLVIYYDGITPKVFTTLALQEDIFPTVMSRMGIPYINNTFGLDLLRRQRQYAVFSTDDKVACMSDSLLYIYRTNSADGIYRYDEERTENEAAQYPDELQIMRNVCFSLLQTSQDMIENNETAISVPLQ